MRGERGRARSVAGWCTCNLDATDIEAAYERPRGRGPFTYAPRVIPRARSSNCWAATFRDPDGHDVALTQWRKRTDE